MNAIEELTAKIHTAGERLQAASDRNVASYAKRLSTFLVRTKESNVVATLHTLVERHAPWRLGAGVNVVPLGPRFPIGVRLDSGPPTLILNAGGAPQVVDAESAARWLVSSCEFSMPKDMDLDACFTLYLRETLDAVEREATRQEALSARS